MLIECEARATYQDYSPDLDCWTRLEWRIIARVEGLPGYTPAILIL